MTDSGMSEFDRVMSECITVYRAIGRESFIIWYELASKESQAIIESGFVPFFHLMNELFTSFQEAIVIDANNMSLTVANVINYLVDRAHEDDPNLPTDMAPFASWFNRKIEMHNLVKESATTKDK